MCSGFLIKSTSQWPFFVLFCFVFISFNPPKVQRFSQLVILEGGGDLLGWVFLRTTQCVAGKSSGKGGAWYLQSSWKSYPGTCSTIFADSDCNYKMSNVMVKGLFQPKWFSEYCGLSLCLPLAFFLGDGVVERGKGDGKGDHTWKKNTVSQNNFFLLLLKNSNISASFFMASSVGPQRGAVVRACVLHDTDGLSFNTHQLWASSFS